MSNKKGGCLIQGTLITLSDGTTKSIENIVVGDVVKSMAISSEGLVESEGAVVEIQQVEVDRVYSINEGLLTVSADHKNVVKQPLSGNTVVTETEYVSVGDKLIDINGVEIEVTEKEEITTPQTVYNIVVENTHSFFANNILTYNQILPTEE
jgi:hypothetical protein